MQQFARIHDGTRLHPAMRKNLPASTKIGSTCWNPPALGLPRIVELIIIQSVFSAEYHTPAVSCYWGKSRFCLVLLHLLEPNLQKQHLFSMQLIQWMDHVMVLTAKTNSMAQHDSSHHAARNFLRCRRHLSPRHRSSTHHLLNPSNCSSSTATGLREKLQKILSDRGTLETKQTTRRHISTWG